MANIIAALQLFALALMGCGVSFKVLLDLALIFAGWTFGNFCISLFERRGVRAHRPGRSLAVGLLILACAIRRTLGKVSRSNREGLVDRNRGASCALCRHRHSRELHPLSASGEGETVSPSHRSSSTNPSVARGGRFTVAPC